MLTLFSFNSMSLGCSLHLSGPWCLHLEGEKSASLWCCSWWYHRLVAMVMMTPSDLPGDSEAHHREFCRPPTHQQLCGFSWRFWRHFCLFPIKKEPWIKVDSKSPLRFSIQVSCWEIKSLCYFTCLSRYNCYLNRLYCFLSSLLIVKSCGQKSPWQSLLMDEDSVITEDSWALVVKGWHWQFISE